MEKNVCVSGKSKIFVKPDSINLNLKLSKIFEDYEKTLSDCDINTNILKGIIKSLATYCLEFKTVNFDINPKYENVLTKANNYISKFVGYQYTYEVSISFENDNKILNEILSKLSKSSLTPFLSINYDVKNIKKVEKELLSKAISDAKNKALIISDNLGFNLGNVVSVDYSLKRQESNFFLTRELSLERNVGEINYNFDFDAKDIEFVDDIKIVWSIE